MEAATVTKKKKNNSILVLNPVPAPVCRESLMATQAQEAVKSPFSKRLDPPSISDKSLPERLRNWKKMETEDEEIAFRGEWS